VATVTVEKGTQEDLGKTFSLGDRPVLVGRANSDSTPDIALNDRYISRRHVEICFGEGRYGIRDLGSTNGTSIDGVRIYPGKTYPLRQESLIGLGLASGSARLILCFRETPTVRTTRIDLPSVHREQRWLSIDRDKSEIRVDGRLVMVARKEFDLICYLDSRAGQICSRDDLIANVWPDDDRGGVANAAIDQLVHRVRKKVELDPYHPARIVSHKGFGYMLCG
jgi:hypothetical protein